MLTHSIFSLLPMFVSLFGVLLLLVSAQKNLSKRFLTFFLVIVSVNYFAHAVYFSNEYKLFAFVDNIWIFTSLSVYPLYYYYIRLLTVDERVNWRRIWIITPAVLMSVFSFILYFAMSPSDFEIFTQGMMYHVGGFSKPYPPLVQLQELKFLLYKAVFLTQLLVYLYLDFRLVIQYNRRIKAFYSNLSNKELTRILWVLVALVFTSAISAVSNVVGKDFFIDKGLLLVFPSIAHSLFLAMIVYVGYYQNFTIVEFQKDLMLCQLAEEDDDDYAKSLDDIDEKEKITKQQIEEILLSNNLFTNPNLRIGDIADIAGTNRTYISKIVNDGMGTNFCDWVNSYRLEYAKELMNDPDSNHLTLVEIAEFSGFTSISVFYRVFKQKEGMPPRRFRMNLN